MSRSLQVKPQFIKDVKLAVKRKSFPSQMALATEVGLNRSTIVNFLNGKPVDYLNFVEICEKLDLDWQAIAFLDDNDFAIEKAGDESLKQQQDWGSAPDVSVFYGRTQELAKLEQSIIRDKYRLVMLLGMGGIGKTSLSVKLAHQIQDKFDCVIYRSLKDAPPVQELLADLIGFLSNQSGADLPDSLAKGIARLIQCLYNQRCLLILDDVEAILRDKVMVGRYLKEYEDYERLFRRVGEAPHQSCLVLVSREKPKGLESLEYETQGISSLRLPGLDDVAAKEIFRSKGCIGSEDRLKELIELYHGNPFKLMLVASRINEVFDGSVSEFLKQATLDFGNIQELLDSHFHRLSDLEKEIMYCLAFESQPISISELRNKINKSGVTDAVASLMQRSLIERSECESRFILQGIIRMYVTKKIS